MALERLAGAKRMAAGAEHLASIFGTEKDKVHCPFYYKIGSCRHGDRCSRIHNKPTFSPTMLLQGFYDNPRRNESYRPTPEQEQADFDQFYADLYSEIAKFGDIDEMKVCDNLCDHMLGNVYIKFFSEEESEKALAAMQGRFYGGKAVISEYSPVTDFNDARCRQHEMGGCNRGAYCNFMHVRRPGERLARKEARNRHKLRAKHEELEASRRNDGDPLHVSRRPRGDRVGYGGPYGAPPPQGGGGGGYRGGDRGGRDFRESYPPRRRDDDEQYKRRRYDGPPGGWMDR